MVEDLLSPWMHPLSYKLGTFLVSRLDKIDSDEIRALLGDDLPAEFADDRPVGERQRKLN